MNITLIEVPYDSGHYARRMGRGPIHLVQGGLVALLEDQGHEVRLVEVRLDEGFLTEVGTALETQRLVAECVAAERDEGRFPLVLSGNCATSVGTMAGCGCGDTAVVWLDSHGDLNTPRTSASGFFDGMVLAMLTGDGWKGAAATVPGFAPVPKGHVALVGIRDLDPPEQALIDKASIPLVDVAAVQGSGAEVAMGAALERLAASVDGAYFHLDLDVLDPEVAYVNPYQAPDGLTVEDVQGVIRTVASRLPLKAAALTAYDAEHDDDGRGGEAALVLIQTIVDAVKEQQ